MKRVLLIFLLVLLLLPGCNSGSGTNFPNGALGRLMVVPAFTPPPDVYDQLKADLQKELEAEGITFDDARKALTLAARPFGGAWLKVGTTLVMVDEDGNFDLPAGASGNIIQVLKDPEDAQPTFTIPISGLDRSGGSRTDLTTIMAHSGPAAMEPGSGLRAKDCCAPNAAALVGGVSTSCLDYDGPHGDGIEYNNLDPRAWRNYIGSTCWRRVDEGICWNERNVIYNWSANLDGPVCFENHRYRYCQDIDESSFDIEALQGTTVETGETVTLQITNKTAGNSTVLSAPAPAKLTDLTYDVEGTSITVRHYNESAQTHSNQRLVNFRADLPAGVNSADIVVMGASHGHIKRLTMRVVRSVTGAWAGSRTWATPVACVRNEPMSLVLQQNGNSVTGTILNFPPGHAELTGTIQGNQITLSSTYSVFTGVINGNTISGSFQGPYCGVVGEQMSLITGPFTWTKVPPGTPKAAIEKLQIGDSSGPCMMVPSKTIKN